MNVELSRIGSPVRKKHKILLLIDDPERSRKITSELNDCGFSVLACENETQTASALADRNLSAAIIFVTARLELAVQIIGEMREEKSLLPIIAVAAEEAEDEKTELLEAGADTVLFESEQLESLASTVKFYCSLSKEMQKQAGGAKDNGD
jgi:DNA-binding response OmpR family regulator